MGNMYTLDTVAILNEVVLPQSTRPNLVLINLGLTICRLAYTVFGSGTLLIIETISRS